MTCLALVMSTVETAFAIQFTVDQTESVLLGFFSQFVENFLTIFIFFGRITFFALTLPREKMKTPTFNLPCFSCTTQDSEIDLDTSSQNLEG